MGYRKQGVYYIFLSLLLPFPILWIFSYWNSPMPTIWESVLMGGGYCVAVCLNWWFNGNKKGEVMFGKTEVEFYYKGAKQLTVPYRDLNLRVSQPRRFRKKFKIVFLYPKESALSFGKWKVFVRRKGDFSLITTSRQDMFFALGVMIGLEPELRYRIKGVMIQLSNQRVAELTQMAQVLMEDELEASQETSDLSKSDAQKGESV